MTTKAKPESTRILSKNCSNGSSPPAEAPIATMRHELFAGASVCFVPERFASSSLIELEGLAARRFFAGAFLVADFGLADEAEGFLTVVFAATFFLEARAALGSATADFVFADFLGDGSSVARSELASPVEPFEAFLLLGPR